MDFEKAALWIVGVLIAPFVLMCVVILLMLPLLSFVSFHAPGNGEHTGFVTATEKGGWPWQTYRAYIKTDAESTQEDTYCVLNQDVYQQLQSAQKERVVLTISHESKLIVPKWECNGESAIITAVN
jgi:hypothetical protein